MPADPVPLIGNVSALSVRNTDRNRSFVSSRIVDELGIEMAEHRPRQASTTSG